MYPTLEFAKCSYSHLVISSEILPFSLGLTSLMGEIKCSSPTPPPKVPFKVPSRSNFRECSLDSCSSQVPHKMNPHSQRISEPKFLFKLLTSGPVTRSLREL